MLLVMPQNHRYAMPIMCVETKNPIVFFYKRVVAGVYIYVCIVYKNIYFPICKTSRKTLLIHPKY